jgi:hypothetical protein
VDWSGDNDLGLELCRETSTGVVVARLNSLSGTQISWMGSKDRVKKQKWLRVAGGPMTRRRGVEAGRQRRE